MHSNLNVIYRYIIFFLILIILTIILDSFKVKRRKKRIEMNKIKAKNECKPNKNNPYPVLFIKIKNEPLFNESLLIIGQLSDSPVEENLTSLASFRTSNQNLSEVQHEEAMQTNILLTQRIQTLASKIDRLKEESQSKTIKASEQDRANKMKRKLLNAKAVKISFLKENIHNLKRRVKKKIKSIEKDLKTKNESSQGSTKKKERMVKDKDDLKQNKKSKFYLFI